MLAEVLFNIICNKSDDQIKKIHSRIFLSASINRLLFLPIIIGVVEIQLQQVVWKHCGGI